MEIKLWLHPYRISGVNNIRDCELCVFMTPMFSSVNSMIRAKWSRISSSSFADSRCLFPVCLLGVKYINQKSRWGDSTWPSCKVFTSMLLLMHCCWEYFLVETSFNFHKIYCLSISLFPTFCFSGFKHRVCISCKALAWQVGALLEPIEDRGLPGAPQPADPSPPSSGDPANP